MNWEDRREVASSSIKALSHSVEFRSGDLRQSPLQLRPHSVTSGVPRLHRIPAPSHSQSSAQTPTTSTLPLPITSYWRRLLPAESSRARTVTRPSFQLLYMQHSHTKTQIQNPTDHLPLYPEEERGDKKQKERKKKKIPLAFALDARSFILPPAANGSFTAPLPGTAVSPRFLEVLVLGEEPRTSPCSDSSASDRHRLCCGDEGAET